MQLAPAPESAAAARAFVERTLRSWGCHDLVDDARVVVTELVSNVVRHAGTDVRVDLELLEDTVRIAVADDAGGRVVPRNADPRSDLGGRGLRLVERFSQRWGVEYLPGWKRVWAEWRVRAPSRNHAHA
jgi:anti-sigma regulatory factor (Ser/Thr protein kinase)